MVPAPVLPVETGALEAATASPPKLQLTVLVVGGSIAGCCTALALRELGAQVCESHEGKGAENAQERGARG